MGITNSDDLSKFPPYLHKHLQNLCSWGRIGLSMVDINDVTPIIHLDRRNDDGNHKFHHFLMKIPYAGKVLKWEVLFDPDNLNFAPDFVFDEQDFPSNVNIDFIEQHLPSLNEWDLKDEDALSRILSELLALYKMEHINRLKSVETFQKYYIDLKRLIESENGIPKENIEVLVENTATSATLTILISLKLDFSTLPDYEQTTQSIMNPGPDFTHLKIHIKSEPLKDTFTIDASLQTSPRINQCLGEFEEFPKFSEEILLDDYMAEMAYCIEERIALVKRCRAMKSDFFAQFVTICDKNLLEYDPEKFQCISFLHGSDDNKYIVKVEVERNFPLEKPTVTISSIKNISNGTMITLRNFPLKPTEQKPEEIARLLMADIDYEVSRHVPDNMGTFPYRYRLG